MGPQSYDCGNEGESLGARRSQAASMGPQSYDCGNLSGLKRLTNDTQLQWGRSRTTAEMCRTFPGSTSCLSLQWGRSRTTAEIQKAAETHKRQFEASMGPQSYDCGNHVFGMGWGRVDVASMGPQSYDCGNEELKIGRNESHARLQWGRSRTTAEIRHTKSFPHR